MNPTASIIAVFFAIAGLTLVLGLRRAATLLVVLGVGLAVLAAITTWTTWIWFIAIFAAVLAAIVVGLRLVQRILGRLFGADVANHAVGDMVSRLIWPARHD